MLIFRFMKILLFLLIYGLFTPNNGPWFLRLFSDRHSVEVAKEERTPDTLTLMFIGDVMSYYRWCMVVVSSCREMLG